MVDRHRRDWWPTCRTRRTDLRTAGRAREPRRRGVEPRSGPRTALAQTERLGRLVGDLDLSRVEEGDPLRIKDVRVTDIFDDAIAQTRADGVRYVVDVRPEDLTVAADPDRLHQLLANLLDNAVRHSPSGGEIRAHRRATGRRRPARPSPTRDRDRRRRQGRRVRTVHHERRLQQRHRSRPGDLTLGRPGTGAPSRSRTASAAAASRSRSRPTPTARPGRTQS